jgi:TRAP-type mannitol/chloroaromatic compound transport system substrate-binding protein
MGAGFARKSALQTSWGLKMRSWRLVGEVTQLARVPQVARWRGVPGAAGKGTIDSAEWVEPYDDQEAGSTRLRRFHYPGWWSGGPWKLTFRQPESLRTVWSSENKAIIDAASALAASDMLAKYDAS